MQISTLRNNELITGISVLAVLRHARRMEVVKCMLIEPLLSYTKVLYLLKRSNSSIKSIEDLILKENITFGNFSARYNESVLLSINSIILFEKLGLIKRNFNELVYVENEFDFTLSGLGNKATNRIMASKKLADILIKGQASDMYLSLRVEI